MGNGMIIDPKANLVHLDYSERAVLHYNGWTRVTYNIEYSNNNNTHRSIVSSLTADPGAKVLASSLLEIILSTALGSEVDYSNVRTITGRRSIPH